MSRGLTLLALFLAGSAAAQESEPKLELRRDGVVVRYSPGDEPVARRVMRTATQPLPLPGIPAGGVQPRATIVLASSPARFEEAARGAPDWSAGVAVPRDRLIVLPAYRSSRTPLQDPIVALRHELVHLALSDYLRAPIPRWFDEGYATWASGEWDEGSGWKIRLALLRGAAPPLDSLRLGWPEGAAPARLAYLLSASAVRYLADRGSATAFEAFLMAWRQEGSFDTALRSVYQITPTRFEREWRTMVRERYGWLLAVSQVGAFWLFLTVLLLVLGTVRKRRDRARLRQMEAEDRMLAAAGEEAEELEHPGESEPGEEWRQG